MSTRYSIRCFSKDTSSTFKDRKTSKRLLRRQMEALKIQNNNLRRSSLKSGLIMTACPSECSNQRLASCFNYNFIYFNLPFCKALFIRFDKIVIFRLIRTLLGSEIGCHFPCSQSCKFAELSWPAMIIKLIMIIMKKKPF